MDGLVDGLGSMGPGIGKYYVGYLTYTRAAYGIKPRLITNPKVLLPIPDLLVCFMRPPSRRPHAFCTPSGKEGFTRPNLRIIQARSRDVRNKPATRRLCKGGGLSEFRNAATKFKTRAQTDRQTGTYTSEQIRAKGRRGRLGITDGVS